jgi:hypothetical protein
MKAVPPSEDRLVLEVIGVLEGVTTARRADQASPMSLLPASVQHLPGH